MNAVEGRDGVGGRARGERMNDAFGGGYIHNKSLDGSRWQARRNFAWGGFSISCC